MNLHANPCWTIPVSVLTKSFRKIVLPFLLIGSVSALPCAVQAGTFQMQFTITGFESSGLIPPLPPPPTPTVTGTITWEAAGIHAPIQAFNTIDMVIDGHRYSASELEFYRFSSPTWDMIGGHLNGVDILMTETDDFWIRWDRDALTFFDFGYASSRLPGIWSTPPLNPEDFVSFNISSIPEPATSSLMILGMILISVRQWQRR